MSIQPLILFLLGFVLIGCSARMVVPAGGNAAPAYAPLNEISRPGIVSYLNAGARPIRHARRQDAYRRMYEQCQGRYDILTEGISNDGGSSIHWGYGITTHHVNQHVYIRFICRPGETPSTPLTTETQARPLAPIPSAAQAPTASAQTTDVPIRRTLATDTQLYPMPSFQATPLSIRVQASEEVRVLRQQGEWMYIETQTGNRGWVYHDWFRK